MALKIIDLVDVQKLETDIVDIDDFNEDSIVKDYVITNEIKGHLQKILSRVSKFERDYKNSFFIYGGYGTGKSHFLAFLYSILTRKDLFEKVDIGPFFLPECFLVKIKASEISKEYKELEKLIFYALENAFRQKYNKDIILEAEREYLEIFTKNFIEHPKFKNFLKEKGIDSWQYILDLDPEKALQTAKEYETKFKIRVESGYTFRQKFDKFLDALRSEEKKDIPVVILLDELADYLDKSLDWNTFNINISFLQEIGEISKKIKLHFIATLQEEKWFGEKGVDREKWQKIRDRFESLTLSNVDFKKIAGQRILRKRDIGRMETIYVELKKRFPSLIFDERDDRQGFLLIYPVHPFVFKAIEKMNLAGGTTRQRTSLGFIASEVEKIKNKPYDYFLSIDSVFDYYFEDPEIQRRKLKDYYQIYIFFQDNVFPKLDREFLDIGEAIIKTLLVLKIGDFEEKTSQEICDLILHSVVEEGINYEIYHGILEDLRQKGGARFLKCITREGQPAYYIDIVHKPSILDEIENSVRIIKDEDPEIIDLHRLFWEEKLKEANFGIFAEERRSLFENPTWSCDAIGVLWNSRNSGRKGKVFFAKDLDEKTLLTLSDRLNTDVNLDFELIITHKSCNFHTKITDDRLFVFESGGALPTEFEDIKRLVAANRIERKEERTELLDELKVEKKKIESKVKDIFQKIYFERGKVYNSKDQGLSLIDYRDRTLGDLIQKLIEQPLIEKYPDHPIFPKIYSRAHTNRLIKEVIRLGKCENPIRSLAELINGILDSLEIIEKKTIPPNRISYSVKKDLQNTKYAGEVLSRIENAYKRMSIGELRIYIRRRFGLDDRFCEVILYSLLKRGKIILIKDEQTYKTINIDEVASVPQKWDFFTEVALPEPTDRENIARIIEGLVGRKVDASDEEGLEIGWQELFKLKKDFKRDLLLSNITVLPERLDKPGLKKHIEQLDPLFRFFEKVRDSLPRKVELQHVDIPALIDARGILRKFDCLFTEREFLDNKLRYLMSIKCEKFIKDKEKIMETLNASTLLEDIGTVKAEFDNFIERYSDYYIQKHEQEVGARADFSPLGKIKEIQEYKNLEKLSKIKVLRVALGFEEINEELTSTISKSCNKLRKEMLLRGPRCVCSYNLEERFSVKDITEKIKKNINIALRSMSEKAAQNIVEEKFNALKEKEKQLIENILKKSFIGIELSDDTVNLLEEVLGKIKEIRIKAKDLITKLGPNEALKINDLKKRFEKILADIPAGEDVRIIIEGFIEEKKKND